ncbi:hypothetical protein D5E85_27340 [Vibrio parahaemolyticus]|nr:hypothetical protein D5E85_27340 [Vibrio parahaemolyticus]
MANKAFKSDSQRLAFSLRSSIAKRCSHLNAALCEEIVWTNLFVRLAAHRSLRKVVESSII